MSKPHTGEPALRYLGIQIFWLVFTQRNEVAVFIQPGKQPYLRPDARSHRWSDRRLQEGYELDAKTAKNVPKAMVGKVLSRNQATALLKKLGK